MAGECSGVGSGGLQGCPLGTGEGPCQECAGAGRVLCLLLTGNFWCSSSSLLPSAMWEAPSPRAGVPATGSAHPVTLTDIPAPHSQTNTSLVRMLLMSPLLLEGDAGLVFCCPGSSRGPAAIGTGRWNRRPQSPATHSAAGRPAGGGGEGVHPGPRTLLSFPGFTDISRGLGGDHILHDPREKYREPRRGQTGCCHLTAVPGGRQPESGHVQTGRGVSSRLPRPADAAPA